MIGHGNNQWRISIMVLRCNCRKYKRTIPFKRVKTRLSYIRSILNCIPDVVHEQSHKWWMDVANRKARGKVE